MVATPPSRPRSASFPQSFGDWAPLLVGGVVILGLALGILNKHVLDDGSRLSSSSEPAAEASTSAAMPSADTPISVSGRVASLRIVAVGKLPARPGILQIDPSCQPAGTLPTSSMAGSATAAGWRFISEQAVAGYQIVMVDAGIERRPDGRCVPIGTSVLVFRGASLVAIAYSRNTPNAVRLTNMTQLGIDQVQLGSMEAPVARLVLTSKTIRLIPFQ
jgi:hypothetical protein